jgi:ribosomal protein S20
VRRILVGLVLVIALGACDSAKEEAYGRLQNQVAAVRNAAEAGDNSTTIQRLASLRVSVASLRQEGVLAEPEAQRILSAAAQVQQNLPGTSPAAAPAPPPAPVELAPQVPGSNSGGSITGSSVQRGQKGEKGENGEKGEKGKGAGKDKDD